MTNKIVEHIVGILFVTFLFIITMFFIKGYEHKKNTTASDEISILANLEFVDYDTKFHNTLFKDVLDTYYPGQSDRNKNLLEKIANFRDKKLAQDIQTQDTNKLTVSRLTSLLFMYLKFIVVYIIVMFLTYYGVLTLGVFRFVKKHQQFELKEFKPKEKTTAIDITKSFFISLFRIFVYFVLFSPAYVIAYSVRTKFNTETTFFMILLGVISNGLLVTYTNKFYTFLISESRKGYVDTAKVKNLDDTYTHTNSTGIKWQQIVSLNKNFTGHIFQSIYTNARFQYLSTIKEQSSFLITGLIIIEMALNIHGHLSYELLRQMFYKNWNIVTVIIFGLFLLVKGTDIVTELLVNRESKKYAN